MRPTGLPILRKENKRTLLWYLYYLGVEEKTRMMTLTFYGGWELFGIYSFLIYEFIPHAPFKADPILDHFAQSGPYRKPSFPLAVDVRAAP